MCRHGQQRVVCREETVQEELPEGAPGLATVHGDAGIHGDALIRQAPEV
jgi:hypothetical protein